MTRQELLKKVREDREFFTSVMVRFQAGDKSAASLLLDAHEAFFRHCARRYTRCLPHDFDDVVNQGRLGYIMGCRRFDTSHPKANPGYPLTYAKGSMLLYVKTVGFLVRLPLSHYEHGTEDRPRRKLRSSVRFIDDAHKGRNADIERDKLEVELTDEGPAPEEEFDDEEIRALCSPCLTMLIELAKVPPRTRDALCKVYREESVFLAEIGREYGVSREAVRQWTMKAIDDMRTVAGEILSCYPHRSPSFEAWVAKLAESNPEAIARIWRERRGPWSEAGETGEVAE